MATQSFLENIVIEKEEETLKFIEALERAEKAAKKTRKIKVNYKTVKDEEEIKKIFSKMEN